MAARKKAATVEDLLAKKARTTELMISSGDQSVSVVLKAVSSAAYDRLLDAHPPTREQKDDGQTYNVDTFAPALIASCMFEPKLSFEQAEQIWTGDDWSRGELRDLFLSCVNLCAEGFDAPFTSSA